MASVTGLADFTVCAPVTSRPQELQQADALLVTVKTYDMETALEGIAHLGWERLSVQNGLVRISNKGDASAGEDTRRRSPHQC